MSTMFVTNSNLRTFGDKIKSRGYLSTQTSYNQKHNTFLSHSTKDHDLLPGVISILENHGAIVYVDDQDKRLPANPTPETAAVLRERISDCRRFVLFVTENSKDSNWIPWELGLGDGLKNYRGVALFPSSDDSYNTAWAEREYMGIYQRIIWGHFEGETHNQWLVQNHHEMSAIRLKDWILSY